MELTKRQAEGLNLALERYKNKEKYVTIAGYAGTGKSTLVRFIIEALQVDENDVAYASYTGKAAEVLRKKGNRNALTLHKLLYTSVPKADGSFFRRKKERLEYKVIVVDEISLAPKTMLELLLSYNVFCIFLGDPFQLPQIDKNEAHDYLNHPHVFLDEIMRQAAESEIIQLTMKIRNGETIDFTKGKEVMVIPRKELVTGHLTWADQIICGTNNTRININKQMREMLGFEGVLPNNGEKMICLRNYWDDISEEGESSLVNGMTGIINNPFDDYRIAPSYVRMRDHRIPLIKGMFISEDGQHFNNVDMDQHLIETGEPFLDWKESYALGKLKMKIGDIIPRAFDYAYAITCHKSQGSEWNNVLVIEERFPFDKKEHARWLYTAVSRSSEKCVLVR